MGHHDIHTPTQTNICQNIFFIFGSEVVLKNNSKDLLLKHLSNKGFKEKTIINKDGFDKIDQTIIENASGSLFGSKIIVEINHDQGKIPDQIIKISQIENINHMDNIAIIINSSNEKLNFTTKWVKQMDEIALIIDCGKLKSFEEKIWLKHQLSFISEKDRPSLVQNISEMNSGNLVAQQNEVKLLRLTYKDGDGQERKSSAESAEFMPFELEDKIISNNTKQALRIIHSIKSAEDHYAPLLVWIVGKINWVFISYSLPTNSSTPLLLYGFNINVILSLPFHWENLPDKSFKFILKEPFGVKFWNKPTFVLSFKSKKTSIELAAKDEYFILYSIFKSEYAGTSILSIYSISVIDGKSFTEIKFKITSVFSPVPYKSLLGTTMIFLLPYIPSKSFLKDNEINSLGDFTLIFLSAAI